MRTGMWFSYDKKTGSGWHWERKMGSEKINIDVLQDIERVEAE